MKKVISTKSRDNKEDQELFKTIYQQYHYPIFKNIKKIVGDEHATMDIFQEVFVALWENLYTAGKTKSVADWLFTVSYNKSIAHLKGRIKDKISSKEELNDFQIEDELYDESHINQQLLAIENAIGQLPYTKRQIFMSSRFEQKSVEQIAEQLNLNVTTVKEYLKQCNRIVKSVVCK